LHMIIYSADVYFWRRFKINYPFIFGFKEGTELGYREVFLLSTGLAVLSLAAVLSNLNMEIDKTTQSFKAITESVPLGLVIVSYKIISISNCNHLVVYIFNEYTFVVSYANKCVLQVVLAITFCPFNIIYKSSRFFLIQCAFHAICAPLYKVNKLKYFKLLLKISLKILILIVSGSGHLSR